MPVSPARCHLVLVANGAASGVGHEHGVFEDARTTLRQRGMDVETHVTESVAELTEVWPGLQDRRVVLLGGDGTLHVAANLPQRPAELALLPAGRANNVARALGIPVDLAVAAELAAVGKARAIDLIAASNGTRSLFAVEGVSVGFHAVARAGYRAPNSADVRAAVRTALAAARRFDGITLGVTSDGASDVLTVGQLFVANLSLFAFGLRVAPAALPDDGLLDVVALPWEGRSQIVPMLARLRRGTHVARPGARVWAAAQVGLEMRGDSPVIADTTNLGTGPVSLDVVPSALALVRP